MGKKERESHHQRTEVGRKVVAQQELHEDRHKTRVEMTMKDLDKAHQNEAHKVWHLTQLGHVEQRLGKTGKIQLAEAPFSGYRNITTMEQITRNAVETNAGNKRQNRAEKLICANAILALYC